MSQNTEGGFTTLVTEKESMEFFMEGLKKASSAARQLAVLQNHFIWHDISKLLNDMHDDGVKLARGKALSRFETLEIVNAREKALTQKVEAERAPSKPKLIVP